MREPRCARVLRVAGDVLLARRDVVELHLDLAVVERLREEGDVLDVPGPLVVAVLLGRPQLVDLGGWIARRNAPCDEKRIGRRFFVMMMRPLKTSSGLAAVAGPANASERSARRVPMPIAIRLYMRSSCAGAS